MIPHDDRGLLLGDGLFETVLAVDGELDALEAHLDRMAHGCVTLGLSPLDRAAAEAAMRQALAPLGGARAAVRLTLTAGSGGRGLDRPAQAAPRLFATAVASPRAEGPLRLALSSVRRNEGSPASRLKTLSYLDNVLARAEARAAGADEAVMLNGAGAVACAGAANIFWLAGQTMFTPALDCGVLAGIARARVIAAAGPLGLEVREGAFPFEDLAGADAVFLTNSLVGARRAMGPGIGASAAPVVARLAEAFS